LKNFADR